MYVYVLSATGPYDYVFLHVDELVVHSGVLSDRIVRRQAAVALLRALQSRARPGLEHLVMPRECGQDEEAAWASAAGFRPAVRVLAKHL